MHGVRSTQVRSFENDTCQVLESDQVSEDWTLLCLALVNITQQAKGRFSDSSDVGSILDLTCTFLQPVLGRGMLHIERLVPEDCDMVARIEAVPVYFANSFSG